jgi:fructose-1,6-bisphosphatase/sedoheptulose 1,7-bisphosphatase-like protein
MYLLGAGGQSETVAAHEASRQRTGKYEGQTIPEKRKEQETTSKKQDDENGKKKNRPIGQSARVGAH